MSRRTWLPAAVLGCAVLGVGLFMGTRASAHHTDATAVAVRTEARSTTPDAPYAVDATGPSTAVGTPSPPVRVAMASIGVDSALQPLGLQANGSLQSPTQWQVAGWYSGGVVPGQVGPAVIIGHIDSTSGPAVFYKLSKLQPGASVTVTLQDGSVLNFQVDDAQSFPKDHFPTQYVYGPTPDAELRLITCTGDFDYKTHNYLNNLVVRAHLVSG
jgi:Sortase domain